MKYLNFFGFPNGTSSPNEAVSSCYLQIVKAHGNPQDCADAKMHLKACQDELARLKAEGGIMNSWWIMAYTKFIPEAQARVDKMCAATTPGAGVTETTGATTPGAGVTETTGTGSITPNPAAPGTSTATSGAVADLAPGKSIKQQKTVKYVVIGASVIVVGIGIYLIARK